MEIISFTLAMYTHEKGLSSPCHNSTFYSCTVLKLKCLLVLVITIPEQPIKLKVSIPPKKKQNRVEPLTGDWKQSTMTCPSVVLEVCIRAEPGVRPSDSHLADTQTAINQHF